MQGHLATHPYHNALFRQLESLPSRHASRRTLSAHPRRGYRITTSCSTRLNPAIGWSGLVKHGFSLPGDGEARTRRQHAADDMDEARRSVAKGRERSKEECNAAEAQCRRRQQPTIASPRAMSKQADTDDHAGKAQGCQADAQHFERP
jgi:hypothetical protein